MKFNKRFEDQRESVILIWDIWLGDDVMIKWICEIISNKMIAYENYYFAAKLNSKQALCEENDEMDNKR